MGSKVYTVKKPRTQEVGNEGLFKINISSKV